MIIRLLLVIFFVVAFPIAWFVSEFKSQRRLIRCTLGVLSILCCYGLSWLLNQFNQFSYFNYNAWYGYASKQLIDTTISQIEAGNTEVVLKELKKLQDKFNPTYENKANYNELVEQAVERMKNFPAHGASANASVRRNAELVEKNIRK